MLKELVPALSRVAVSFSRLMANAIIANGNALAYVYFVK